MKLSALVARLGGRLVGDDVELTSFSSDSRHLRAGDCFIALRGPHFDAEQFLGQVQAAGACAVVVRQEHPGLALPQWVVADTLVALQGLAVCWREQFPALQRIAITGSSGKTTCKQMLASVLSRQAATLATVGNLNNDIGVPLTLLALRPEHRYAVLELGANHVGEIAQTVAMVQPEIALITNIGWAHFEGFGGRDGIARAKMEIYTGLQRGAAVIVNADDDYAEACQARALELALRPVLVSLRDARAHLYASAIEATGQACFACRPVWHGQTLPRLQTNLPGLHNLSNACLVLAVALELGIAADLAYAGLTSVEHVGGRLAITQRGSCTLIDDTYNANPASCRAAIDVLAAQAGRKILVLGDMKELGSAARQGHSEVGAWAKMKKIDALYTWGEHAEDYAAGYGETTRVCVDKSHLIRELQRELQGVVSVLVKGSRSARMEDVVQALLDDHVEKS